MEGVGVLYSGKDRVLLLPLLSVTSTHSSRQVAYFPNHNLAVLAVDSVKIDRHYSITA